MEGGGGNAWDSDDGGSSAPARDLSPATVSMALPKKSLSNRKCHPRIHRSSARSVARRLAEQHVDEVPGPDTRRHMEKQKQCAHGSSRSCSLSSLIQVAAIRFRALLSPSLEVEQGKMFHSSVA